MQNAGTKLGPRYRYVVRGGSQNDAGILEIVISLKEQLVGPNAYWIVRIEVPHSEQGVANSMSNPVALKTIYASTQNIRSRIGCGTYGKTPFPVVTKRTTGSRMAFADRHHRQQTPSRACILDERQRASTDRVTTLADGVYICRSPQSQSSMAFQARSLFRRPVRFRSHSSSRTFPEAASVPQP